MPEIDLELQLQFLKQLNEALDDAVIRYEADTEADVDELRTMREEVLKASQIVTSQIHQREAGEAMVAAV